MKKVLRYKMDDLLSFINDNMTVFDVNTNRDIRCNVVVKMANGDYRVLVDGYLYKAEYFENKGVLIFHQEPLLVDCSYRDMNHRLINYNDRVFIEDKPEEYYIDEYYILGSRNQDAELDEVKREKAINSIYHEDENLSQLNMVEKMLESYTNDYGNNIINIDDLY